MDETESPAASDDRVLLDGRYELVEKIGSGGMAEVWRARDVRLQRDVALKLLSGPAADPSKRRRIEREARALAATSHPNIVSIYDYGEAQGDHGEIRPYLVMELIDGPDLHQYLQQRGALPADEARDIMLGILGAVEYAHASGVVHGDLKPANICVGSHGPKVGDFGVARILSEETGTTTAAATPTFAAPEVLKGDRPTPRADVYSASCLAFELLAGRPPYEGTNAWEVAAKHIDAPIPRVRRFRSDVPAKFEAAIQKGMEKDPKRRHKDAGAFAAALREVDVAGAGSTVPIAPGVAAVPIAPGVADVPTGDRTQSLGPRPNLGRAALFGPLATVAGRAIAGGRWAGERISRSRHKRALLVGLVALLLLFAFLSMRESGVAMTSVPNVRGVAVQGAAAMLRQAGLRVDGSDVSFRPVAEGEGGRVLRTIPAGGTEVKEGTKVHIIASVPAATPAPAPQIVQRDGGGGGERKGKGRRNGGDDD